MANEVHYGKCGSDEGREGRLAVKSLTRVVQVHLISDIIHLYVINYSLKFCNYCFVLFVMRVYLPPP